MSVSVIIPSKSAANLVLCIAVILQHDSTVQIIVIDDGLEYGNADLRMFVSSHSTLIPGVKPFIFARNVNLGIQAAGDDDVILLNDDALLETPGGFTALATCAKLHPKWGVISAVTNVAGNPDQQPRDRRCAIAVHDLWARDAGTKCVAFVCVLIPRCTIALVGLLDERFTAYGWEDNDYCRRVRNAGLKVGIFDGCFVDHGRLRSTFRGDARAAGDIHAGARIYQEKWGDLA